MTQIRSTSVPCKHNILCHGVNQSGLLKMSAAFCILKFHSIYAILKQSSLQVIRANSPLRKHRINAAIIQPLHPIIHGLYRYRNGSSLFPHLSVFY